MTEPCTACPFAGCECAWSSGAPKWRMDRLVRTPGAVTEQHLYDTETEAVTEAARLNAAGIYAVAWEEPTWVK